MARKIISILLSATVFAFLTWAFVPGFVSAAQEETIVGTVVKSGKAYVIETDEGDYIAKGKDLSKMMGKLVEVTGIITESEKGDTIEVKSVEEIQE
ncbi:MAG: DUF5818 domain-containing protein [Syntrophobacteraceae bacterium]